MTPTHASAQVSVADEDRRCWCCGTPTADARLLALGAHPEVEVCLACAHHLALRARERRDRLRPTLAGRGRDLLRAGRRLVVDHGWHQLPLVGRVLQGIGRFTP